MLDVVANTASAATFRARAKLRSDSLVASYCDMLRYEDEATEVREFLARVPRRGDEIKEYRPRETLRVYWTRSMSCEIQNPPFTVKAISAKDLKIKQPCRCMATQ